MAPAASGGFRWLPVASGGFRRLPAAWPPAWSGVLLPAQAYAGLKAQTLMATITWRFPHPQPSQYTGRCRH